MKVLLENIVSFQSIEEFENSTGLVYDDLTDSELFDVLTEWHHPGEHDTNWYDAEDIDSNFLGYRYNGTDYLMATYERGLIIGLSFIKEVK